MNAKEYLLKMNKRVDDENFETKNSTNSNNYFFNKFYNTISRNTYKLYDFFISKKYFTLYSENFSNIFLKLNFGYNDVNDNTRKFIKDMIDDIKTYNLYNFEFYLENNKEIECSIKFDNGIYIIYYDRNNFFRLKKYHLIDATNYCYKDYENFFKMLLTNEK